MKRATRSASNTRNSTPSSPGCGDVKPQGTRDGYTLLTPYGVLRVLNLLGGRNGIGRVDIVENRFVGMKSRGIYETPGGTILLRRPPRP